MASSRSVHRRPVVALRRLVYHPRVMRWIANLVYFFAAIVYTPVLAYQIVRQGKNRRGWRERFGHVDVPPREGRRIWVHAVSLGEVNAARTLIESLERTLPDCDIVISSTTDTGYARACALYGQKRVFRYPLDFSWIVARALRRIEPAMLVLVELEVWYNAVRLANQRGVRVAVVNGRLTERSAARLGRLGPLSRSMFAKLSWVCAQDQAIAARFETLGVQAARVQITGSMKWDTATVTTHVEGADQLAGALGIESGRPLWVCGSTGPGEETIVLDAYRRLMTEGVDLTLAIIPRKPERFDEVARLIEHQSFRCVRRTNRPDGSPASAPLNGSDVILGDTMGELRKFYSLADVVFVGRSLVPMGGSDPMEVAALGKAIIAGPHLDNFAVAAGALRDREALRIASDAAELATHVRAVVADPSAALVAGDAARQVVTDHQGATEVTVDALARLLASERARV